MSCATQAPLSTILFIFVLEISTPTNTKKQFVATSSAERPRARTAVALTAQRGPIAPRGPGAAPVAASVTVYTHTIESPTSVEGGGVSAIVAVDIPAMRLCFDGSRVTEIWGFPLSFQYYVKIYRSNWSFLILCAPLYFSD
ncbi:hypothetical protein WA026_003300 [Henosepilachna vigintioctopunctata]|uniref:Secreted protein n=1 Tax=Henosepilachna vigintioctopunctata TaxID=420089 RepID=A0AAW1TIR4_9CUCU